MVRIFTLFLFIFSLCFAEAKLPELTPADVQTKVKEILKCHVSYKDLTPELIQRVFQNYLNEIDPTKTYFIDSETRKWEECDEIFLQKALEAFNQNNFTYFHEIHDCLVDAIYRRNQLEAKVELDNLPTNVDPKEFKDLKWAETVEELLTRLTQIKALQVDISEKLGETNKDLFFQRVRKRRLNHETRLLGKTAEEREKIILSTILKATTCALDSHTNYFTPMEANQFMIQVQQRLFGIGAQLRDNLNGLTIVRILEGGPASQTNKLKIHDRIIAVDQEPIVGMDIIESVELIRGEKGSPVVLTILRDTGEGDDKRTEKLEVELQRGEVVLEESRLETFLEPFADGVIAHLRLFSFYEDPNSSSSRDIRKAINQIKKDHKLKGVLLDLRSNAGGLLPQAVSVTGLFIKKGIVVSIKDDTGRIQHLRDTDDKVTWDGPLVVLTNRASASAAEIVAQTLQDYGRAIVVGDKTTFGKGTFQVFTLDHGDQGKVNPQGEYKVTRGKYYTVSGKSPQLKGVLADIEVPGILSPLDIGEQFAKYPLENDSIEPNFEDNLTDIPVIHRQQIARLYKHNLQTRINTFTQHVDVLTSNSSKRIQNNKNYQNFLKEIKNDQFDSESVEIFGQSDLQLVESMNVLKDLIFLIQLDNQ